jgi:hypothetical protein
LLDERAAAAPILAGDEALAELTRRYFATRGPATTNDFAMWSGLTVTDAKRGLALTGDEFASEQRNGATFWFKRSGAPAGHRSPAVHLLPNYDEYFIGFVDRSAMVGRLGDKKIELTELLSHVIVIDGEMVGSWRRTVERGEMVVETKYHATILAEEAAELAAAAGRYSEFLEMPVVVR